MKRILTYQIPAEAHTLPISTYLKSLGYSSQNLVELKKMPDSVMLNHRWVYLNETLHLGDELKIQIYEKTSSEKIVPIDYPLDIVYEDPDLMVINKPAGMPIHPSMKHYDNSLANAVLGYFKRQGEPFIFRCINRLDRETSGLTIVAKHMISGGMLSAMVAAKSHAYALPAFFSPIHREYLAIVKGVMVPSQGTVCAPIARKEGSIIERTVDFEKGDAAITHYKVLSTQNGHSLVSLNLETGRTHQIRVHMKYLGFPLIGDYLYNPDMERISRQALHSYHLKFTHPITHEQMDFTAPLPSDMKAIIG